MNKKKPQERGIRKKGNSYYVNIQTNGLRKEVCVGPDKSEAVALRRRLKLMAQEGTLQDAFTGQSEHNSITYSQAIEEHWQGHLKFKKSGEDMRGRLNSSEKFFENRDISTLKWEEIEQFRNKRLSEVKPATVKQDLDMMHAVLQRQIKTGRLKENPLDKVDRPTFNNTREEVISHSEFISLLSAHWEIDNRGFKTTKHVDPHLQLALIIADFTH